MIPYIFPKHRFKVKVERERDTYIGGYSRKRDRLMDKLEKEQLDG